MDNGLHSRRYQQPLLCYSIAVTAVELVVAADVVPAATAAVVLVEVVDVAAAAVMVMAVAAAVVDGAAAVAAVTMLTGSAAAVVPDVLSAVVTEAERNASLAEVMLVTSRDQTWRRTRHSVESRRS